MLRPGTRLGRYLVLEPVGRGGMSFVYKARNTEDRSFVALKFPHERPTDEAGNQMIVEGMSLVHLHHPNIVKVRAVRKQEGWPYIVMEFVDGVTLAEQIAPGKGIDADEVYRVLWPIADALDYIHANHKVHRDVKPGNIKLNSQRRPILVDFGIVQTGEPARFRERVPRGSPWYMSPEQTEGKRATGRSDQYSLAIVAYEMLLGRLPFDGDPRTVIRYQREAKPPMAAGWNDPIRNVMQKALQKNPETRFSDCREFMTNLLQASRGYMVTSA